MSDVLPNQNNPSPTPPVGSPPPFGSSFNPHANPQDPNNPYASSPQQTPSLPNNPNPPNLPNDPNLVDPVQSWIAKHEQRDGSGKFTKVENTLPPNSPDPSNPSGIPNSESNFKKIIKFIVKIKWVKVAAYLTGFAGVLFLIINYPPVQNLINHYFPNSSPVFARPVSLQGTLRESTTGVYSLVLPNQEAYTLHFKPSASLTNLKKLNEVIVKGNLTVEPFVIENAEIYPLNFTLPEETPKTAPVQTATPATSSAQDNIGL